MAVLAVGRPELVPVELEIVRVCAFKAKTCGRCGKPKSNPVHRKKGGTCVFQRRNGCVHCGKAKSHADHYGAPDSWNAMLGRDPQVYRQMVDTWAEVLRPRLEASGLPKGLGRLMVEGECSFGDGRKRDQGNHRGPLEKAVADAAVRGGYLIDDEWSRFEFGNLVRREDGGNWTRLMLFPAWEPMPMIGDRLALPV